MIRRRHKQNCDVNNNNNNNNQDDNHSNDDNNVLAKVVVLRRGNFQTQYCVSSRISGQQAKKPE